MYKVGTIGDINLYKPAMRVWYEDGTEEAKREFIEEVREEGLTVREFETKAECKAYIQGIEDAEGYLDVFIIPEEDNNIL